MPRVKGVRICALSVEPVGGVGYSYSRIRVPSSPMTNPKTAKEAFDLFWSFAEIRSMTHDSALTRRLQSGISHADKILRDANKRKVNVLVLPKSSREYPAQMQELLQELNDRFVEECGERWGKLLLGQVRGGGGVKKVALPANAQTWPVHTGHMGIDRGYARIGAWLDSVMPVHGLELWKDTREEYMQGWEARQAAGHRGGDVR